MTDSLNERELDELEAMLAKAREPWPAMRTGEWKERVDVARNLIIDRVPALLALARRSLTAEDAMRGVLDALLALEPASANVRPVRRIDRKAALAIVETAIRDLRSPDQKGDEA